MSWITYLIIFQAWPANRRWNKMQMLFRHEENKNWRPSNWACMGLDELVKMYSVFQNYCVKRVVAFLWGTLYSALSASFMHSSMVRKKTIRDPNGMACITTFFLVGYTCLSHQEENIQTNVIWSMEFWMNIRMAMSCDCENPRAEIRINYLEMPLTLFLIYWHSQTQSMHPTFKGQDYHGNKHSHKLNHKWQTLQLSSWSVDNGAHKMHTICTTRNSVHSSTKILWILWIFSTVLLSATVAVFVSIHF